MPLYTPASSGSASLTSVDYTLGADVNMTNSDQFYDGPSGSFAAGTWLIIWKMAFKPPGNTSQAYIVKLWDGTTVYDETEQEFPAAGSGANYMLAGFGVATLAATTTLKISAQSARAADVMQRDTDYGSSSTHTHTRLVGVKIA